MNQINCFWLRELCTKSLPPLSAPAFCLGQPVQIVWFSEERDRTLTDEGVIVGIACKQPDWLEAIWVYSIQYTRFDDPTWILADNVDWVPEAELRAIAAGGDRLL